MGGESVKRAVSALVLWVCMAAVCCGAAGWKHVVFLPNGGKDAVSGGSTSVGTDETGETDAAKEPQWLREMGGWDADDKGYIIQFTEGGTEYTVTMETCYEDKEEGESICVVCLWRGDERIQQFSSRLSKESVKKWWLDDLNFDGFPDLLLGSVQGGTFKGEYADGCHLYLWDAEQGEFHTECMDIPSEYVRYEENEIVVAESGHGRYIRKRMYGRDEDGKLSLLRQWDVDYWDESQVILDMEENGVLYNESMDYVSEEEGEEIFWSGILDRVQERKTYWTVEAEDYTVSLQDLIPERSLQLVLDGEKGETILRVYRKEMDYESPSAYSATPFENLLGHNGFYMDVKDWFNRRYYYAVEYGRLVCLADSFRPAPFEEDRSDYMVDLDGDGDRELICNVMYGGDGAAAVEVYHYYGIWVLNGSAGGLLDAEDWYNWGTNSQWAEYLPDENVIRIHYTREEDGVGYKDYAVDFEKLNMSRYGEKY